MWGTRLVEFVENTFGVFNLTVAVICRGEVRRRHPTEILDASSPRLGKSFYLVPCT